MVKKEIEMKKYNGFQERVINELEELNEKLSKLSDFLQTEFYDSLPQIEQDMLLMQKNVMTVYANILASRISRF